MGDIATSFRRTTMRRYLGAATAAVASLLLAAGTALGGGWATITPDAGNTETLAAGEIEFGFTVLQHGETPAGWEQPTLRFENVDTGKGVAAAARGSGADGHFVATITLPEAGLWRWHVTLRDLFVETPPAYVTVTGGSGQAPALTPTRTLSLVERALADAKEEMGGDYGRRLEALESELAGTQAKVAAVARELDRANESREQLEATLAALPAPPAVSPPDGGLPSLAMVTVGALAGAIAGFAMAYLGRATPGRTPGAQRTDDVSPSYAPTTH
jgi:hypothetical protein